MSSQTTIPSETLSDAERAALLKLLADDDPVVYGAVRGKILSSGAETGEWLRPHLLSADPLVRRRAREIVTYFDRLDADTQFLAFCLKHGEEFNIEEGAWLLARTAYSEINIEAYQALLDDFAVDLEGKVNAKSEAETVLRTLNEYFYDRLGFVGNEQNYYDPENSYLNRVVDRRTGNPISLSVLYLMLGRRLKLPIAGIGLPGHFLCQYQSSSDEIYLDVFNQGQFLTKADCIRYLLRGSYSLREEFLSPMSARRILMRMCSNLHKIYHQLRLTDETTRLQRYIIALAR